MESKEVVKRSNCDMDGCKHLNVEGVEYYHNGTPVFFVCCHCDPETCAKVTENKSYSTMKTSDATQELIEAVANLSEDDLLGDELDTGTASTAASALYHVRSVMRGTPYEKVLTEAIAICEAVADRAAELF
jgi:hypothetical protein